MGMAVKVDRIMRRFWIRRAENSVATSAPDVVRTLNGWVVVVGTMYSSSTLYTSLVCMTIPDYIKELHA